ncbi:hypothetical protein BaRGS_00013845 [Batillaria attramentaria]|uniref:Uncharacterized protein n=1 Tax=Batillaria attramentaria TaxID=370345 RepID=A0ABD0L632_9CAEN
MFWTLVVLTLTYQLVCWALSRLRVGDYSRKHVLITGCDTGFGNLLAKRLDGLGFNVFAGCLTSAGAEKLQMTCSQRVTTLLLDVTNEKSIVAARDFVDRKLPTGAGLWGVVNNAGISGPPLPIEWLARDDYVKYLNVNLFGMADVTRVFLPLVRKERGRVVNIREVYRQGVKVCMVEPGMFKTEIINVDRLIQEYKQHHDAVSPDIRDAYPQRTVENFTKNFARFTSTMSDKLYVVVDAYELALTSRFPPTRQIVGNDARFFYRFLWNLPAPLCDWVLSRLI